MCDGRKRILGPFTGCKKRKVLNNTSEKYMPEQIRQNLAETDRWLYYNQEEWLEEFLDENEVFSNGSESDASDNDHENHNENNK